MARPTGLEPASSTHQADTLERSLPSASLGAGLILASSSSSYGGPDSRKVPGAEILGLPNSSVERLSYRRTTRLCAESDEMVNKPANALEMPLKSAETSA